MRASTAGLVFVPMGLDLDRGAVELTAALVDIPSVSGDEERIADAVEAALQPLSHLLVTRIGNNVIARTALGLPERVVIAGHLDTVPIAGNLPSRREGGLLYGCGSCDMKAGVAVALRLAATVPSPTRDVTFALYACEEVESERNGLGQVAKERPELFEGDFAVLMEPSGATVEAGCQGTLQLDVTAHGHRAHSARSWMGRNAIHEAAAILDVLRAYAARRVTVDGLEYREGLNAVGVRGGVAGNVIPDECVVSVNYRFAPSRSVDEAVTHMRKVFAGFEVAVTDAAPGALPGLDRQAATAFVAAVGRAARPKFGWTDVSRFAALGVPAVNYGPGDPGLAHTREEHIRVAEIIDCEARMRAWLAG
jgi:succinyl-diaminopimelate desuccinylase